MTEGGRMTGYEAPPCPTCGARLEMVRQWQFSPWEALCVNGHLADAWWDPAAEVWRARPAGSGEPLTGFVR